MVFVEDNPEKKASGVNIADGGMSNVK